MIDDIQQDDVRDLELIVCDMIKGIQLSALKGEPYILHFNKDAVFRYSSDCECVSYIELS